MRTAGGPIRAWNGLDRLVATRLMLAQGWTRRLIAILAGALSALAMPPFGFFPILAVTLPAMVFLLDGAGSAGGRSRVILSSFGVGWWFGFGYFLAGLYWIGAAFLVQAETFAWLMPFAVVLLPAGLAFFFGFGTLLARLAWSEGPVRILVLAASLAMSEWARGHVLSGFPWNLVGASLAQWLPFAQSLSVIGSYGLTLVALAVFAAPAAVVAPAARRAWRYPVLALLVLAGMAAYGAWRLQATTVTSVPDVMLRIVQPSVPQDERFRPEAKGWLLERYANLSQRRNSPELPGLDRITFLIWPESAFPYFLIRDPDTLARIAALLPRGVTLLTGAARPDTPDGTINRVYNSVYVINDEGTITGVYDKVHLVPFGEYLPLKWVLERMGLEVLTRQIGGFTPGSRRRALTLPGAPAMAPLICYEVIFPGAATPADMRPGWILNVTNDAWFGNTAGPYQHFLQTRMRAIEEGLPIVRAANSGISAVIDPLGRAGERLELGVEGAIDSPLPAALPATIYARFGEGIFAMLLVLIWMRRFHLWLREKP